MDQSMPSSLMDLSVKAEQEVFISSNSGAGDNKNCTILNSSSETLCRTKLLGALRSSTTYPNSSEMYLDTVETLAENILLKKELREKLDEILALRTKLSEETHSLFSQPDTFSIGNHSPDIQSLVKLDQQGVLKFPYDFDYNNNEELPEDKKFCTSICEWVEENRNDVVQKVTNGSIVARDVVLGGVAGLTTAFVLQKFGKLAVTALGGGFLLLQAANYRGYIIVNWNQIYNQLEQGAFRLPPEEIEQNPNFDENDDWVTRQFKGLRDWSKNNSKFVVGFLSGFVYQTYF